MHRYPFIPITVAFAAGITASRYGLDMQAGIILFVSAVLCQISIEFCGRFEGYGARHAKGFAPIAMLFALGIACNAVQPEAKPLACSARNFEAEITAAPQEKPKSIQVYAKLRAEACAPAQAALYLQKDSLARTLGTGDLIYLQCKPEPTESDYLLSRGIHYTTYVPSRSWTIAQRDSSFNLQRLSENAKEKLIAVFYRYLSPENAGMAAGLCLGDTSGIGKETKNDFAATGVSHILSVSGMHVGLIYIALCKLLSFMSFHPVSNRLKHILVITAVWAYTFLCGLPAPGIRSAAMASIMAGARMTGRKAYDLNTLSFSCFCLLAINPAWLFDVGFQLSYAAVAGILTMGKAMTSTVRPENKILRTVWEMTAVSIAAQAATLPLCLYYFHQFPNYFLLANFLIGPASTLLIYLSITLMAVSFFPPLAVACAWLCDLNADFIHISAKLIAALPYSQTTGLTTSLLQTCIITIFIASTYLFLKHKKFSYLATNLASVIVLLGIGIWNEITSF